MITDWRAPGYYSQICPCPLTAHRDPNAEGWPATDPPPEIVCTAPRPADAPQEPRAVLSLQRAAQAAGWPILVGYSRGPVRAQRVGTYKRVEVFGIQAAPHPDTRWRFWALYSRTIHGTGTWSWRVSIWKADQVVFTHATITDLQEFIAVRGSVTPAWFKGIHARVEDQKEQQRLAARNRKPKAKEGAS
jgi:hypothetical protein